MKNKERYTRIAFVIYMVILLNITAFRPWDFDFRFMDGRIVTSLFTGYRIVFQESLFRFCYLLIGNIIMFIPFGLYCVGCKKKTILSTSVMGFSLSFLIETAQYVLGVGASEVDDLVLNTIGCLIGGIIAKMLVK